MQLEKQKEISPAPQAAHESSWWESVKVAGEQLDEKIESLIREGNIRRVVVKQEGRTIAEFPLTVGVVGAAIAPVIAAIGAIAALVTECTVEIERVAPPPKRPAPIEVAPIRTDEATEPAAPALTP